MTFAFSNADFESDEECATAMPRRPIENNQLVLGPTFQASPDSRFFVKRGSRKSGRRAFEGQQRMAGDCVPNKEALRQFLRGPWLSAEAESARATGRRCSRFD